MKPKIRADCEGPGICPKISCRYNTLFDVRRLKKKKNREIVNEIIERAARCESTCALDYADNPNLAPPGKYEIRDASLTKEQVGEILGMNPKSIDAIERRALEKLRRVKKPSET